MTTNTSGESALVQQLQILRAEILRLYTPRLRSIAHRFDSEDLFQSVCLQAISTRKNYRGENSLGMRAWIRTIAENNYRTAIRAHCQTKKRSIRRETELTEFATPQTPVFNSHSDPDSAEWLRQIREYASELPALQSKCFHLRYFRCQEIRSIADQLGITPNATRKNISYAKHRIRSQIHRQPVC